MKKPLEDFIDDTLNDVYAEIWADNSMLPRQKRLELCVQLGIAGILRSMDRKLRLIFEAIGDHAETMSGMEDLVDDDPPCNGILATEDSDKKASGNA